MRTLLLIAAIVVAALGGLSAFTDWYLSNFLLDRVDWEGPLVTVQTLAWLGWVVSLPFAVILVALAGLLTPTTSRT